MEPPPLPRSETLLKKAAFRDYARSKFRHRSAIKQTTPYLSTIEDEEDRIEIVRQRFRRDYQKIGLLSNVAESRRGLIQHLHQRAEERRRPLNNRSDILEEERNSEEVDINESPLDDFKAGFMYFEKRPIGDWQGKAYKDDNLSADFPNQKVTLKDILSTKSRQLFRCEGDNIKYFHFPANHMEWIEASFRSDYRGLSANMYQEAIATYYDANKADETSHDENKPEIEEVEDKNKQAEERPKLTRLLSRENWRGQLVGGGVGRDLVHMRHMRHRCAQIAGALFLSEYPKMKEIY